MGPRHGQPTPQHLCLSSWLMYFPSDLCVCAPLQQHIQLSQLGAADTSLRTQQPVLGRRLSASPCAPCQGVSTWGHRCGTHSPAATSSCSTTSTEMPNCILCEDLLSLPCSREQLGGGSASESLCLTPIQHMSQPGFNFTLVGASTSKATHTCGFSGTAGGANPLLLLESKAIGLFA